MSKQIHPAFQRALALQRSGDARGAAVLYRQILQAAPKDPQLLFLLGSAELQLGNYQEAEALLERSVRVQPNQPKALCNLGLALHELGRHGEALAHYDRAIARDPHYAMAYNNRGTTLLALGRRNAALDSFARAIAIEPRYPEALNNQGGALREEGDLDGAVASFDRALALAPAFALAHLNRGMTLNDLYRQDEALTSFDRALQFGCDLADVHCGRATALFGLKRLGEAEASNERALALDPGFAQAAWNRAMFKLCKGEMAEGWKFYELRWKLEEWRRSVPYSTDDARQTLWTGEQNLAGKTLLVRCEQGFGDFVQFSRYIPMILARGARVTVEVKARLLPLMATLDRELVLIEAGQSLPVCDYFCPVMSLPLAFRTTMETVPANIPYLFADPLKQHRCLERLGPKTAPRIGLVWSGNPQQAAERLRSIPLDGLRPMLQMPFAFHSLQKETAPADGAALAALAVERHDDEQSDFSDAAALIACMDLVITSDTAIAHVAGAMGKPVWIMLAWMAEWRWLLDRSDSPWYPTASLFRQQKRCDWAGVIARIVEQLRAHDFA